MNLTHSCINYKISRLSPYICKSSFEEFFGLNLVVQFAVLSWGYFSLFV